MELIEEQTEVIVLTAEQEYEMNKNIKIAMFKHMHQKGMLTDEQLRTLISMLIE